MGSNFRSIGLLLILFLTLLITNCTKAKNYPFIVKNYTNYKLEHVDIEGNKVTVNPMDTAGLPVIVSLEKRLIRTGMQIYVLEFSDNSGTYKHNSGINAYINDLSTTKNVISINLKDKQNFPNEVFQIRVSSN
jgi:hypothetical protein